MNDNIIQIYGQDFYHSSAYIMGTREGLRTLCDALYEVVHKEDMATVETSDSQGEWYAITIRECTESELESLQAQYTDTVAKHTRGGVWPGEMCK